MSMTLLPILTTMLRLKDNLPPHLPLIEIDYNDIGADNLTRFRYSNVTSTSKLAVGQTVTCYQSEDGTYTSGIIRYLNPITFAGRVEVFWDELTEYV